jgi:hypothetical protein
VSRPGATLIQADAMMERSTEARLMSELANARIIPGNPLHARNYEAARKACETGTAYYVISRTQEQSEDIFAILADDQLVVTFELAREDFAPSPSNVITYSVHDYQKRLRGRAAKDFQLILKLARQR